MEKAIISRWECPSCGNRITKQQVFSKTASGDKYSFSGPTKCGCGRTGRFRLLDYESASAFIKSDKDLEEDDQNEQRFIEKVQENEEPSEEEKNMILDEEDKEKSMAETEGEY